MALVAWWKLNGDLQHSSMYGRHGTNNGSTISDSGKNNIFLLLSGLKQMQYRINASGVLEQLSETEYQYLFLPPIGCGLIQARLTSGIQLIICLLMSGCISLLLRIIIIKRCMLTGSFILPLLQLGMWLHCLLCL